MQQVAIPLELHARLKAIADDKGMKLRALIERALKAYAQRIDGRAA